jgi:hypothetical protein
VGENPIGYRNIWFVQGDLVQIYRKDKWSFEPPGPFEKPFDVLISL